jgi:hypothetical protein
MFQKRRAFVRMASVAAGVSCLALAACSSTASSGGTASSASASGATGAATSTADPLASMSAAQVAAEAVANAKAASSLTLAGSITQTDGTGETANLAIKPSQGCTGTIGTMGKGSFKLTKIGSTIYLNPDKQFWESNGGAAASTIINLVNGKYIKIPSTDKNMASLADLCDVSQMFSTDGKQDTLTKGKVTTLNGTRVLPLNDTSEGSVSYVTDTSKPQLVEITSPKSAKDGSGKITVTYGAPVTLTAPPASQVLDGSKLGL